MKNVRFLLTPVFLLISLVFLFAQSQKINSGLSPERIKNYESFIKSEIEHQKIPGAVTLVMHNGVIAHKGAYGYNNSITRTPMKTDDIFFIQSMTKPVITVALMMLYEEGHFLLTDPISKYIPAFKNLRVSRDVNGAPGGATDPLEKEITFVELLSHTSGLTHGLGQSQLDKDFIKGYFMQPWTDIKGRAGSITNFPLVGQPGKQWNYSAGHDVASMLIEQFSGLSTDEFLRERIFKPLGMNDTGYNLTKAQQAKVVKVHSKVDNGALILVDEQPKMEGNTIWSGVNGLFSTAQDYMNFCQMLLNNGVFNGKQLLSRKTIEVMTYNYAGKLYSQRGEGFGLGFAVMVDASESRILSSNGMYYWAGAFNTHFFIDPKENLISIFMTQEAHFTTYYHEKMRQLVYQALYP
jgi:CubicO group peptidase (beta-lactamase class C family)